MGCKASKENPNLEMSEEELAELQRQRALARMKAVEAQAEQDLLEEQRKKELEEAETRAAAEAERARLAEQERMLAEKRAREEAAAAAAAAAAEAEAEARRREAEANASPRSPTPEMISEEEPEEAFAPQVITEDMPERYQRLTELSRTTEYATWLARDTETGEKYAIRVYDRDQLEEVPGAYEALKKDIELAATLDHPNLVKVHRFIDNHQDREAWVVMEYAPGQTLAELVASLGKFGDIRARKYIRQLLLAVQYLHHSNIAHRDLKPESILVQRGKNNKDIVKIADFGSGDMSYLAQQERLAPGQPMPRHIAPEIITPSVANELAKSGFSGFASDVWSLGSILYFMIYGTALFQGKTLPQTLTAIRAARVTFPRKDDNSSMLAKKCLKSVIVKRLSQRATLDEFAQDGWVARGGFPEYVPDPVCVEQQPAGNFERACCARHAKQLAKYREEAEEGAPVFPQSPGGALSGRRSSVGTEFSRNASQSPGRARRGSVTSLTFAMAMQKHETTQKLEAVKRAQSPAPRSRRASVSAPGSRRGSLGGSLSNLPLLPEVPRRESVGSTHADPRAGMAQSTGNIPLMEDN